MKATGIVTVQWIFPSADLLTLLSATILAPTPLKGKDNDSAQE